MGKEMVNETALAKKVGLHDVVCPHCGRRIKCVEKLKDFFDAVISACRSGLKVRINRFGTFEPRMYKAREVKSPVLKGGTSKSKSRRVLVFRSSVISKEALNRPDVNGGKHGD